MFCSVGAATGVYWLIVLGLYNTEALLPICKTARGIMMTSSNGNFFRVTGSLSGKFTGHRWIPITKANDAELLMFSLNCVWINTWINNREVGDLRRYRTHHDVIIVWWGESVRYFFISVLFILAHTGLHHLGQYSQHTRYGSYTNHIWDPFDKQELHVYL